MPESDLSRFRDGLERGAQPHAKGCRSGFWGNPECGTQPETPEVMFGFQDNSEREPRLIFPKRNFQDSGGNLNVERGQGIPNAFSRFWMHFERGTRQQIPQKLRF